MHLTSQSHRNNFFYQTNCLICWQFYSIYNKCNQQMCYTLMSYITCMQKWREYLTFVVFSPPIFIGNSNHMMELIRMWIICFFIEPRAKTPNDYKSVNNYRNHIFSISVLIHFIEEENWKISIKNLDTKRIHHSSNQSKMNIIFNTKKIIFFIKNHHSADSQNHYRRRTKKIVFEFRAECIYQT